MKKEKYVAPECDVIEVQAQAVFAGSQVEETIADPWSGNSELEEW